MSHTQDDDSPPTETPSYGFAAKFWWSYAWRSFALAVVIGMAMSLVHLLIALPSGHFPTLKSIGIVFVIQALSAIPINIWTMRFVLKKYGFFIY